MKIIALQDNLSKVQAVEQMYQQMLRFPDDIQQAMAGELRRQRRLNQRRIKKSKESNSGELQPEKNSKILKENEAKGRMEDPQEDQEEHVIQCCIDFRV